MLLLSIWRDDGRVMSKYLDSSLIKPNHWYMDEKGEQFLYCGRTSMTD